MRAAPAGIVETQAQNALRDFGKGMALAKFPGRLPDARWKAVPAGLGGGETDQEEANESVTLGTATSSRRAHF